MPAILLREGFQLTFVNNRTFNILLAAMIIIGNLSAGNLAAGLRRE